MRSTWLHFRNPKEATPSAYYPLNTNAGLPLNRFEFPSESESKRGTFSTDERFAHGSIYKDMFAKTSKRVGPGAYKDEEVVEKLKKKPCMSTYHKPFIGPDEGAFDMQGYTRILQVSYLPRRAQDGFVHMVDHYKENLGRKVNETLVFHQTLAKTHATAARKRNQSFSATMSPELLHVSRIRNCYEKYQRTRERQRMLGQGQAVTSPRSHSTHRVASRYNKIEDTLSAGNFMSERNARRHTDQASSSVLNSDRPVTAPEQSLSPAGKGAKRKSRNVHAATFGSANAGQTGTANFVKFEMNANNASQEPAEDNSPLITRPTLSKLGSGQGRTIDE